MVDRVSFFNGDAREAAALLERMIADARHAFGNREARKATAIVERPTADARHAIRDREAREATAIGERPTADARHAIRNREAREATAPVERIIADARQTIFDNNRSNLTLISVPRHCIIIKIRHRPRAADRQHTAFGVKRPSEIIPLCSTGTTIGFGRCGQNENRHQCGNDND